MKGFIVHPTYENLDNKTIVYLYGRLENNQSFVAINEIEPYFFIKESDLKKVEKLLKKYKVEKTSLANFSGNKVAKISSNTQTELNKLFQALHKKIETYEADIKPHYRFMMNNNLLGSVEIEGDYELSERVERIYKEPKISSSDFKPSLKIASIDTEWDKKGNLYCIGIYGKNINKTFMVTKHNLKNVVSCKSESEVLEKFKAELIKFDPDIITGWNLIDFDLKELQELAKKNGVSLDWGRSKDSLRLRIESNFFRSSSAEITGRQVLDGLNMIRDPFIKEAPSIKYADFETYTLESVAQVVLGEGKLIKGKGRNEEITSLYEKGTGESHQKLADYNLKDCKLVYDIIEKAKFIELAIERSQLTGLPFDRLTASIAAFDSLYIREAHKKGLVSPTMKFIQKEEKILGGYVKESVSGIYHNILVLDFKSLYPSILKTFNIDPASYVEKPKTKDKKDIIESPNKAYFKNQEGVLPGIIHKLHEAREKAKKEKRELSSFAIKIIMNSFWGVLASPNCRYFDFKMASAITNFAQFIIKLTAKEIEKLGYKVIYSDTDSVFIESNLEKQKANAIGKHIEEYINKFYKEYTEKNYNRRSFLELEFKKQYLSFLIPKMRGSEAGSKKRYAGLTEENGKEHVEIVGLEAIRGDWTEAAKDFQIELLNRIFRKEEFVNFIRKYVKDLKSGKFDEKLVYRKSIRKPLSEYTKTTPPHVKAARKLDNFESNIVEYVLTEAGPEPMQKLKHKIDYEHYIEKQLKPIANTILYFFSKDFDEIINTSKQMKLF